MKDHDFTILEQTIRQDERNKVIEKVEKLKYGSPKSCDESYWYSRGDKLLKSQVYFEALTDVLNQLKGSDGRL